MRPFEMPWDGGEQKFLLTIDQLKGLEQRCDAGPYWIYKRLGNGTWLIDDVFQTIRFGLEGADMETDEALELVHQSVDFYPLLKKTWRGGEHDFRLDLDHLRALQDRCGIGPMHILQRLIDGTMKVNDVIEPIRLALLCAWTEPEPGVRDEQKDKANSIQDLMTRFVYDRPLLHSVNLATEIMERTVLGKGVKRKNFKPIYLQVDLARMVLGRALLDDEDDPVGELEPVAETQENPGHAENNDGVISTAGQQSLDSQ